MILNYRSDKYNINPTIGCVVLNNPVFFKEEDWIETPSNWANSVVQGKSYSTEQPIGHGIWKQVEGLLNRYMGEAQVPLSPFMVEDSPFPTYGNPVLTKVRLGQGAFRVLVTDAYSRKCSITGEKTLPVLEAAHIRSYSESGPHLTSNGILLRSDMHKLFDNGYLTVTKDYKVEVSNRIKEEFQNGKEYYQYHGKDLLILPVKDADKPDKKYIEWHNTTIYRG